ncbi:hypothetical protein [Chishuiella sp.]|uniref:hypothetical protein n=1 Tax=Chishuiella sp. TaxID=1969467 RepID=UPI0028B085ED|nr:hypothetical protein [Chishuiella sp.]
MIKKWIIFIINILFPVIIFSQELIDNSNQKDNVLLPGTSTSISLILENITTEDNFYDIKISSSTQNISPILKSDKLRIVSKEKKVYVVPLKISTETTEGKYKIKLEAISQLDQSKIIKETDIYISEKRDISLLVVESPDYVKAGEKISINFLVKNLGNIDEHLSLESKNAIIDKDTSIVLKPKESRVITIYKTTDSELKQNEIQNINLSVLSKDNPNKNTTVYSSVKIISTKPEQKDIYHRLPISASISQITMENMNRYSDGFQGEIYGRGSLDEKNKNRIEFRALTANPVEFNSFVQYEEYFLNYKNDHFFAHIGDKTYSASYLTEYARYGRGIEIQYNFKKFEIGGFYNRPRFFRDIKDEFNIYSSFKIRKNSEIKIGYLYKTPKIEDDNFSNIPLNSDANIPYITGKLKASENITLLGEIAYSKTKELVGNAYMLQGQARFKKIDGSIIYMRSNPKFAGYFTNTNSVNGNLNYKIAEKINFFANYIKDAKNFERDTLLLAAPYRDFFQYGIQYNYHSSGSILFYNGFQKYQDRLEPKQFDYNEKYFKVSINQQLGIFKINIDAQIGQTDNYLTGFKGKSSFYTSTITFDKFRTSFNLFASYANTSRYLLESQKQFFYGARVISHLSDKTNFSLFYQNNYLPEEYYQSRNLFEIIFHQQLFPGHEVDLSGRYALHRGQLGNKDYIFSLKYTMRINIPIKKIAEYVTLSGNINRQNIQKIDGIKLTLGNYISITDKNGNYTFKNIIPGDYFLEIDRSTLNINDITTIPLPILLSLNSRDNIFNFGLTTAATIYGDLEFFDKKNNSSDKKESVIVEASHNEEIFRKIVVLGEKFNFTYLRPGDWKVTIYRNGLDKRYKIAVDTFQFNLKASEEKEIKIKISKQQNEIKYQQETIKINYNTHKK